MRYGRFVGRVGSLAVALGVGLAGPAVAAADPEDKSGQSGANADTAGVGTDAEGPGTSATGSAQDSSSDDSSSEVGDPGLDDAEPDDAELDADLDDPESSEESGMSDPSVSPGGSASDLESTDEAEGSAAEGATSDAETPEESRDTNAGEAASRSGADPVEAPYTVDSDHAHTVDEADTPAAAERNSLAAIEAHMEADSAKTDDRASAPAAVSFSSAVSDPVTATPEDAVVSTGLAGIVSKFLAVLGIGPSAANGGVPLPTFEFVTVVLGAIRREFDRLFFNDGSAAASSLTSQAAPAATVSADDAPLGSAAPMALASPMALTDSSSSRVMAAAASAATGTMYQVTTSGPDIVDFDPAKDKLDLGDVSVHNFIVVDTPEGVGFRSPWTGDTAIVVGVSLGQLTVDSFAPIINDHLRQDLSGALAWEHGITPAPNAVYARSHEVGQIDRVAFDPATDVVDFRHYGSREQIYIADSPEGVIISNAGTGQALILQGATKSELTAENFVFHAAQVREDRLHQQLGFSTLPDSQILPQGVPVAGTNTWPTAAGNGTPPAGKTGTTTVIGWHWGTDTVLDFDPDVDKLDFGWFQADNFDVTEQAGSTQIEIVNNDQTYTLDGVALNELQTTNIIALDNATRVKWQDLIFNALQQDPLPRLSVDDAIAAEGDAGTSDMDFTVRLSKASGDVVTASYTTSNGSATAAGLDYEPTVGTITFNPGETSKLVRVAVTGDTMVELDEQFTLNLSAPVNATIGDGIATGTIVNDDVDVDPAAPPAVSIADLSVVEGNGEHSHFMFVATLDKASSETVTVNYATADGTATAGSDYSAATGTLNFAPGVTSQLVHVDVLGDATVESDETFTVVLSSPTGATIADGTAVGTIINDDVATDPGPGGGINSGNPGDELWGEAYFAPYVDMAGWPVPDLIKIAQDRGVSLLTLGFLQATPGGSAAWGGYPTLTPGSSDSQAQAIDASIAAFKDAGGDVMISLGGASGTSLAQSYAQRGLGAQDLADAYAAVADTYSLNRIDFDIEGAAAAEPVSIALRSEAIALLQQARPDLEVWYTLPVLPTGLTHDGLTVVDSALKAGVKLDGVNVMAMDYGESAAPTSGPNAKTMGAYAIESAVSTHDQMTSLFGQYGQDFGWNQLGVTPMIGVNDVLTEVFTVADAEALEDFARAQGLGMVSMWSVNRDTPGTLGQASANASGLDIPAGSFGNVWNDYGTINEMDLGDNGGGDNGGGDNGGGDNGGGGNGEAGTTTVIGWHWGTDTVLDFDPAADKLDFGWFQPANFEVTEQAGSTRIEIVNNNQTYTLNGVALNQMKTANIIALDSNTVAKWQALINGGGNSDPQLPTVSIGDAVGAEGDSGTSNMGFTVSLSEASANPVSVGYTTGDGTAVAGADYAAKTATVTFAPGITSQVVNIVVLGDTSPESNETFTVTLSSPTGATIADGTAIGTITDDDNDGGDQGATTTVIGWHWGTDTVLDFDPDTDKLDFGWFQPTNFEVTEQAGSTQIEIVNNNQTYTLRGVGLSQMQMSNIIALDSNTVAKWQTLINNGGSSDPRLSIGNVSVAEGDGAPSHVMFTATLDKASTTAVTVNYATANGTATAGSDYAATSGTLTFDPGVTSQMVHVDIIGDTVAEPDETFTVTLSGPTGATIADGTAVATIINDDAGAPILSVANTSIQEGDSGTSQLVFNLSLSAAADEVVTVDYRTEDFTAAAGTDYQATEGTLTFEAGETSKQVTVTVLGDTTFEGNESLLLVLSGVSGAQFDGTDGVGLIRNDDANPEGDVDPEYRVVGYFTEWSIYQRGFDVADIPAELLTDINYAFADINDAGEVVLFDRYAAVEKSYPGDTWDQPVRGNFNQLAKLKEQNPDVNVLISIGGWTLSEDFSDVALTEASREKFAASAVDFITTYGFDGIDLDWEYPVEGGESDNVYRPEDTANYVLLVQEIRRQLDLLEATDGVDDKEYLLTIASPAGYDKIANYDLAGMAPYLDWFQVMAYDFYGAGWSNQTGHLAGLYANPDAADPLYNTDHAVRLYLEQVDPSKIVLGAPLYGHSWRGVPDRGDGGLNDMGTGAGVASYGDQNGNISYWHIMELLEEQPDVYQVYWDEQAKASYIYSAADGTFISYESPEALQYRLDYIKDLGLGGVMFWEIDDDIRDYDHPQSLLALAARELLGGQNQAD